MHSTSDTHTQQCCTWRTCFSLPLGNAQQVPMPQEEDASKEHCHQCQHAASSADANGKPVQGLIRHTLPSTRRFIRDLLVIVFALAELHPSHSSQQNCGLPVGSVPSARRSLIAVAELKMNLNVCAMM